MNKKKTGVELIAEERQRQIEVEGWTKEHDAEHWRGQMADAAVCYLLGAKEIERSFSTSQSECKVQISLWPWDDKWWKPAKNGSPKQRIKELQKAGALIAAEIDRLQNI